MRFILPDFKIYYKYIVTKIVIRQRIDIQVI